MNQENFNLVSQVVAERALSEDERLLERLRITRDRELPQFDFLFRIFGRPCFPRGELIAVTGKAKSGKTLFTSMLMACCVREEVLQIQRPFEEADDAWQSRPLRCLWYDTEQSEQSTQDILKNRINRLVNAPGGTTAAPEADPLSYYDIFNVRSLHYDDRLRLFEKAVRKYRPDLVVLDGVRDLIADINDGVKAQAVMEHLMRLAQEANCCIVCVLHQNKGAEDRNLRGWIGTELMNKAFEVYACEKVKPDNVFAVEQTHTRKYDLEKMLFFRMDPETEVPVGAEAPLRYASEGCATTNVQRERNPPMNPDYVWFDGNNRVQVRKHDLFYEVLKAGPLFYNDLESRVIGLLKCGTPLWNNMFCEMRDSGYIVRGKNPQNKTVWMLATPRSGESPSS